MLGPLPTCGAIGAADRSRDCGAISRLRASAPVLCGGSRQGRRGQIRHQDVVASADAWIPGAYPCAIARTVERGVSTCPAASGRARGAP